MAQHDYVIDNQSFPATRSDLNSLFQAIASCNSGATAPSTTYANQLWYDTANNKLYIRNEDNDAWIELFVLDQTGDHLEKIGNTITLDGTGNMSLAGDLTVDTDTLFVDASANAVGIGTSTVSEVLHLHRASGTTAMKLTDATTGTGTGDGFEIGKDSSQDGFIWNYENSDVYFGTNNTQRMAIDNLGNLLVGTTTATPASATGVALGGSTGYVYATRDGGASGLFNRITSDGEIAQFRRDGTTVGSIGSQSSGGSARMTIGKGDTGLWFLDNYNAIAPFTITGNNSRDNAIDLGISNIRFDDIYATNQTIQPSDQTMKQQIASLTDTEITAAKAISKLFKTFKWNDSVEDKGDNARKHTGHIAQEVQQAMTDAGLDAGDYAFFISSTWWETQTDVPAVAAVDAVDAVYEDVFIPAVEEQLDDEGNVIVEAQPERTEQRLVSEAVEAVEAQDAYTRTDTYDTGEEAPAGATERTRLGIRYPELLAFVGAATEQRLADIETRLTALEA